MVSWGPAAPDTIGLDWAPAERGDKSLTSRFQSLAWEVPAAVVETIDDLKLPVASIDKDGYWIAEVYPAASIAPPAVTTTVYRPNADNTDGVWVNAAASNVNLYQSIDEAVLDTSDYIYPASGGVDLPVSFEFASGAWPALQRVLDVRLHIVAAQPESSGTPAATLTGRYDTASTLASGFGGYAQLGSVPQEVSFSFGEIDPATVQPWQQPVIAAFDSVDDLGLMVSGYFGGASGVVAPRIYQMWIEIDWIPETRIVVGVEAFNAVDADGWKTFDPIVQPTGGVPNWSKTAQSYVVALRPVVTTANSGVYSTAGAITVPWLDSGEALPTGWQQAYLPIDRAGTISAAFADYETTRSVGLLFSIPAAGVGNSADGQPFADNTAAVAYTGNDVEQEITTGGTGGVYGRLRFLWGDKTATSTNGLTVRIKRRSDNVQFGSTESFTLAQLRAGTLIGTMIDSTGAEVDAYLIERDLTGTATLAAATQYYVEFSAVAVAALGHEVMVLRATTPAAGAAPTGSGASTFGGTTDQATYVSAEVSTSDVPVTLSTIPTVPANFAAALATETLETEPEQTACPVVAVDRVNLSWNATSLAASFGYYEIQRDNGDALAWQTIAQITTEAVVTWAGDLESIRGSVDYRIRAVRSTDDEVSAWSSTATVTRQGVPADPTNPVWIFTSNLYPSLTCAYHASPTVGYRQTDGPRQTIINRYGVDGAVRVVETERRLEAFDLTLTVSARGDLTPALTQPSRRVFDPILALCSQTSAPGVAKTVLPYVCCLDAWGSSWYAALSIDLASVALDLAADEHTCIIRVEQLTETPYVVDISP